jgi:hypothetical protein
VKRELVVGMTAGVFVMEDFILSGWMTQASMRHVNRIDVEPCGTKQCVPATFVLSFSRMAS